MQEALLQTRKELAHALYQHDAACHVIARLQQENAEMRERLANQDQRIEELLSVQQPEVVVMAPPEAAQDYVEHQTS